MSKLLKVSGLPKPRSGLQSDGLEGDQPLTRAQKATLHHVQDAPCFQGLLGVCPSCGGSGQCYTCSGVGNSDEPERTPCPDCRGLGECVGCCGTGHPDGCD